MQGRASLEAARSEVKRIDRDLDTLLDLILKGGAAERINAKMVELEARKGELELVLTEAAEPPPLLHPEMATFYREQVAALHSALGDTEGADRAKAAERLRSLVGKIVLTPEDGRLVIDVHGDLAGILAIAHGKAPPAGPGGAVARAMPNADIRGQRSLPKHKGRPWGTADVAEMLSKVKLVAGAGFEPTTFRL
jgi:site-specific DNA recombinase